MSVFPLYIAITLWRVLLWQKELKRRPRDTTVFRSRFRARILIAISCHIYRNASKVRNRNSPSIRYSTISSMFYIPAFNGINSAHGGMNWIDLMSINGIIAGQKMVLMRNSLKHRWYTCLIPNNLTRLAFMEIGQIWSKKKRQWHRIFRTQRPERWKGTDPHW